MNWLEYEEKAAAEGYKAVCGVDEAGRGPLAGPVCAAAVILPQGKIIAGVNDSKKLSEKKREALFEVIKAEALSYCIAYASVEDSRRFRGTGFYISMPRNFRSMVLTNTRATAPRYTVKR